jgi:predicted phosphodiesterase
MAPYLIVSDIHANMEALRAVLDDSRGRYEKILCLGDLVGYGADPNPAVEWARANLTAIVRGNHDKACCGNEPLEDYHPAARMSATWTREELTSENLEYLDKLARGPLRYDDFDLSHGSPADEDEYVLTVSDASPLREAVCAQTTFFGHTHLQGGFVLTRSGARRIPPEGIFELEPDHYYLVNPGAVGQPRDGDPRAAYAIYSPQQRTIEYRRVDYDIDQAASKIRAAGLPASLAARLYAGT